MLIFVAICVAQAVTTEITALCQGVVIFCSFVPHTTISAGKNLGFSPKINKGPR